MSCWEVTDLYPCIYTLYNTPFVTGSSLTDTDDSQGIIHLV